MHGNQLEGELPAEIGKLTALRFLNVSANNISGTLPNSMGELRDLNELQVRNGHVTALYRA